MSMHPSNYNGIEIKYIELKSRVEKILSPKAAITFPEYNINTLEETSALKQQLNTALVNVKENSDVRSKYEYMLNAIISLEEKLSDFIKKLYSKKD